MKEIFLDCFAVIFFFFFFKFFFLFKTIHMSLQTNPVTLGNKLLNFSAADVKVKEGKASNPHFAQSLGNICMLCTDFISVFTSFLPFHNDCFAPHKNLISLLLIYPTTIVFSSRKVYSGTSRFSGAGPFLILPDTS